MANDSTGFFYWYRRYKVRAQDMNNFQDALAETARGLGEGSMGAAVLRGLNVVPVSGFVVNVSAGIATAASGYLEVMNQSVNLDCAASSNGSLPNRSLVVITPNPTDANFINSPTSPFNSVPLNQLQKATIMLIPGNPSQTPNYPSKGANDVILCGLKVPPGAVAIDSSMLDFEARESIGMNSLIAQNQVRFDNRLRPYRAGSLTVGIKPSQTIGSSPVGLSYPGRLTPSAYPLSAGAFNPLDTIIDFSTGMISGGDTTTPSFTPHNPGANASLICLITLTKNDVLKFNFGTAGGYAQCLASIKNQVYGGAGGLPAMDGNFPIAYVILTANSGNYSDVQVLDARPFLGSGSGGSKFQREVPAGSIGGNAVFTLSKTPSDPDSLDFYVDSNLLEKTDYTLSGTIVTITNSALVPVLGQTVYAKYLIDGAINNAAPPSVNTAKFTNDHTISGAINGSNNIFTLTNTPVDPDSLFFWVDENVLEDTDYTLAGSQVTITNPDFIPQPGQTIFAKYLQLGTIFTGGGGGLPTVYGTPGSPIMVNPLTGVAVGTDPSQVRFVSGLSGFGPQSVTAIPQIMPGSAIGQELLLKGVGDPVTGDFLIINDGNGVSQNGAISLHKNGSITYTWDGSVWNEDYRR